MSETDSFERASAAALRFLSYRPRSQGEVRARLRRGFPSGVVESVIESLAERSLLDDGKFARLWSNNRDALNPRSAAAIRRELISKGVPRDDAEAAVSDLDDQDSAYRAGLKPARRLQQGDFPTFRRKLWGYLRRRGFSESVTRHTIGRLWDERPGSPSGPPGDEVDC
jgi:regulatory protein